MNFPEQQPALAALVAAYERQQAAEEDERRTTVYAGAVARLAEAESEWPRVMGAHERELTDALAEQSRANARVEAAGVAKLVHENHYTSRLGQLRLTAFEARPRILRDAEERVAASVTSECARRVSAGAGGVHDLHVRSLQTALDRLSSLVGVPLEDMAARIEKVLASIPPAAPDFAPMPAPEPQNFVKHAFDTSQAWIKSHVALENFRVSKGI